MTLKLPCLKLHLERMQPRLFSEDWTVPVRTFAELSALPGIAVVPRAHVPATVRQVGYTRNAVAIVIRVQCAARPASLSL